MMNGISILLLEGELFLAKDLKGELAELGYGFLFFGKMEKRP